VLRQHDASPWQLTVRQLPNGKSCTSCKTYPLFSPRTFHPPIKHAICMARSSARLLRLSNARRMAPIVNRGDENGWTWTASNGCRHFDRR
jgi:hypothetical protein